MIALHLFVASACEAQISTGDLRATTSRALSAIDRLDTERFESTVNQVEEQVPCLDEPVTTDAAAGLFLALAIRAQLARAVADRDGHLQAYASLSDRPPPSTVAPEDGPLWTAWEAARGRPSETTRMPVPLGGHLFFDGLDVLKRPSDRPTLAQFVQSDGTVQWSRVLYPGEALTYDSGPESTRAAYETTVVLQRRPRPIAWAVLTGALVVGSGALGAMSVVRHQNEPDCGLNSAACGEAFTTWRRQTNGFTMGAVGLGTLAVVGGTVTVVRW